MAKTNSYSTGTPSRSKLATGLNALTNGSVENYNLGAIADLFAGTKGADIASATTTDIGAATGVYVHVTGTTTITGLGTVAAGAMRWVVFDGALLLTHNATSLILPSGANITTAAGDGGLFVSEGSGNWRCLGYWRKDGTPLTTSGTMPQNSQSAAYTLVLADAGKHILHPSADTTARIFTIPANSSVAFPIGTMVTFINQNSGGVITLSITTDTLRLAGTGTTGNRTLAANGVATAIKLTSTEWIVSGTGLT
jgi:hypothetical protein